MVKIVQYRATQSTFWARALETGDDMVWRGIKENRTTTFKLRMNPIRVLLDAVTQLK